MLPAAPSELSELSSAERRAERAAELASAALEILDGADAGRTFPLDGPVLRIGRGLECNIRLEDPTVAPVHCLVLLDQAGTWRLTRVAAQADLRIDGIRSQTHRFEDAPAILQVGRVRLRFRPSGGLPIPEPVDDLAPPMPEPHSLSADLVLPDPHSTSQMALVSGGPVRLRGCTRVVAPFLMQRRPVSNRQYLEYLAESGAPAPEHWLGARPPAHLGDHPVVGVQRAEASGYAQWRGLRLPSSAEWVAAALGTGERRFPWGHHWEVARCACRESGATGPVAVDTMPAGATPEGCLHMLGNVWEWTGVDDLGLCDEPDRAVVLGGAFGTECNRGSELPNTTVHQSKAYDYLGFRCAADIELIDTPSIPGQGLRGPF